jgi:hypothetical protein
MKLSNFAVALSMAALLPTFANAGDNMDAFSASFDRDLNREYSVRYVPSTLTNADPLDMVNVALLSGPDQVRVSFERDINRETVAFSTLPPGRDADPLVAVNAALHCGSSGTINARITGDLGYC